MLRRKVLESGILVGFLTQCDGSREGSSVDSLGSVRRREVSSVMGGGVDCSCRVEDTASSPLIAPIP